MGLLDLDVVVRCDVGRHTPCHVSGAFSQHVDEAANDSRIRTILGRVENSLRLLWLILVEFLRIKMCLRLTVSTLVSFLLLQRFFVNA